MSAQITESRSAVRPAPRIRFWSVVAFWFVFAPMVSLAAATVPLSRGTTWLLLVLPWLVSLAWVISGYRRAHGPSFGYLHTVALVVGLSAGIALLASSGLGTLFGSLGLLPGAPGGS